MHGIVRTDKMAGTNVASYCISVRYAPSGTATAIDNGNFAVPAGLVTGEREIYTASTPAANSALDALVLIASEPIDKKKKYNADGDFENAAGATCRAYRLHKGDIFSLSADAFTLGDGVTPTVGTSILEAQAGAKGLLVNSGTSGSTKIASLIAKETFDGVALFVFQV